MFKNLDEAIERAEQIGGTCDVCGQENAQLAKWLKELKKRREFQHRLQENISEILNTFEDMMGALKEEE